MASFNVISLRQARAVLLAAEGAERPLCLGVAARHWTSARAADLVSSLVAMARASSVPVALHLDHLGPEQGEILRAALEGGFTSIMFDGSALPLAQNIERTAEVVRLCRPRGVSVEGELGGVGGVEGEPDKGDRAPAAGLTDPDDAATFVSQTGVTALAVGVGTVHGAYVSQPDIRVDLISRIAARTDLPLVLHGATGIPDDVVRSSVAAGIRKINFFSGFLTAAMDLVRETAERDKQSSRPTTFLSHLDELEDVWRATARQQIELYRGR